MEHSLPSVAIVILFYVEFKLKSSGIEVIDVDGLDNDYDSILKPSNVVLNVSVLLNIFYLFF